MSKISDLIVLIKKEGRADSFFKLQELVNKSKDDKNVELDVYVDACTFIGDVYSGTDKSTVVNAVRKFAYLPNYRESTKYYQKALLKKPVDLGLINKIVSSGTSAINAFNFSLEDAKGIVDILVNVINNFLEHANVNCDEKDTLIAQLRSIESSYRNSSHALKNYIVTTLNSCIAMYYFSRNTTDVLLPTVEMTFEYAKQDADSASVFSNLCIEIASRPNVDLALVKRCQVMIDFLCTPHSMLALASYYRRTNMSVALYCAEWAAQKLRDQFVNNDDVFMCNQIIKDLQILATIYINSDTIKRVNQYCLEYNKNQTNAELQIAQFASGFSKIVNVAEQNKIIEMAREAVKEYPKSRQLNRDLQQLEEFLASQKTAEKEAIDYQNTLLALESPTNKDFEYIVKKVNLLYRVYPASIAIKDALEYCQKRSQSESECAEKKAVELKAAFLRTNSKSTKLDILINLKLLANANKESRLLATVYEECRKVVDSPSSSYVDSWGGRKKSSVYNRGAYPGLLHSNASPKNVQAAKDGSPTASNSSGHKLEEIYIDSASIGP